MRKVIDNMAVIFPFEVAFYKKHNLNATFVGHPLAGALSNTAITDETKKEFLDKYQISADKKIIAFLPGSRGSEIANHLPIYKQVLEKLASNPEIKCFVSRYDKNKLPQLFASLSNVHIIDDNFKK